MAITRYSNFDKTVNTIADRNNIANKVPGMTVVVLDAIADVNIKTEPGDVFIFLCEDGANAK